MKRAFNHYTDGELLTLENETINDAIRIEAIERGFSPPMTLSEVLRKSEWKGYQKAAEAVEVFEILTRDSSYGSHNGSQIAYLTEERAKSAMEGIVFLERGYSATPTKLKNVDVSIQKVFIGVSPQESKAAKFEEYLQDDTKFNEVRDECLERLGKVRQADYNRRVNTEKMAEYLRLAGGDEGIAKGFWAKVEKTEWPAERGLA